MQIMYTPSCESFSLYKHGKLCWLYADLPGFEICHPSALPSPVEKSAGIGICVRSWVKSSYADLSVQFAATACTIVSGAIAERTKFETYILYSFFMAAWVYPVLTHSIWSTAGWAGMFRYNLFISASSSCLLLLSAILGRRRQLL